MKAKRLLLLLLLISLGLLLVACAPDTVYHTVTFDSNGGTAQQNVAIESGNVLSMPKDPEWVGYTFLGWYFGETLWDFENNTVTSDITLKAKWERITYTVSFNSDGGTNIGNQTIGLGDYVAKPKNPTKDGCIFLGWYVGNTLWDFDKAPIMSDTELTAKWEKITYKVTFDANGGNQTPTQTVAHGESITKPIDPTKQGNRFLGWYFGDMLWDFEANKLSSDITLVAKWESTIVTHRVTFMRSESVHYDTRHAVDGEKLTPPTPPESDRQLFVGWYLGDEEFDFENTLITGPLTLTAKWQDLKGYVISFDTGEGSAVDPIFVLEGTLIDPPETTHSDLVLDYWTYNGEEWDFSVPPTSNMELVAVWAVDLPMHEW